MARRRHRGGRGERRAHRKGLGDLFTGHNRLGKTLLEDFGLKQQFHSHADSHVGAQEDIETLLAATDAQYLNLCLDTGHAEYCGASSLELIKNYPDRIGYLHLKQINPDILKKVNAENMTWAAANLAGVMTEPPNGLPDLRAVIEAVEALNRPIFGIVEQDMYPVDFDVPMPIAKRTRNYLLSCGSRTAVN